jgi:DNA-binding transcriptional LysR family regulator
LEAGEIGCGETDDTGRIAGAPQWFDEKLADDLAIRTAPPPDSRLIARRLTPWRHVLCCTPAYLETHEAPASPTELVQHDYLSYSFYPYGDEWRFTGPYGQLVSVHVAGNVVTNSRETLRFHALEGQGVFLAPSFVVADQGSGPTVDQE